ncbi:MAG: hypothetical protein KBD51_03970 [Candidatus Levybacteria bacterium]|nr:hypothetical protein [Candidatus Levybacteria bacterium]
MNSEFTLKKVAVFLLLGVALFAIPITVFLAQREQDTRSSANVVSEDTVVAVINGKQITKAAVRAVAEESNKPADVTPDSLKDALLVIEEREILENAVNTLGIQLDSAWVGELTAEGYSENEARYQVLKNQIIIKAVKSRSALTVQFWNTPEAGFANLTAVEKEVSEKQLSDGIAALSEAETSLVRGDNPIEIGDALIAKYESLKPVLAVNGVIVEGLNNSERDAASHPQIYQFGDSGLDQEAQSALFEMGVNDVETITDTPTNRGGIVFKVISANDTGAATYDEWYTQQKSSLVQNLNLL